MADANSVNGVGQTTGQTSSTKPKSNIEETQDRFLRLLTTQMRNQDPLNPMDNAQVTTQMAQINTVAGIDKLNESMAALSKSMLSGQAMQAASVIGRQALVQGDMLTLTNGVTAGGVELASDAENVTVSIFDAQGRMVSQQDLGAHEAGMLRMAWDGKDDADNQLPDGNYVYTVQATNDGEKVDVTKYAFARVNSVLLGDDGVKLDVGKLGSVSMTDVKQIV